MWLDNSRAELNRNCCTLCHQTTSYKWYEDRLSIVVAFGHHRNATRSWRIVHALSFAGNYSIISHELGVGSCWFFFWVLFVESQYQLNVWVSTRESPINNKVIHQLARKNSLYYNDARSERSRQHIRINAGSVKERKEKKQPLNNQIKRLRWKISTPH